MYYCIYDLHHIHVHKEHEQEEVFLSDLARISLKDKEQKKKHRRVSQRDASQEHRKSCLWHVH